MIKHPLRSGNGNEPPPKTTPTPDAAPGQPAEADAEPAAEPESDKK